LPGQTRARIFFPAALLAGTCLAAGCTQPLGPGFYFAARQTEIHASPGTPDRLHIRVVDRLENTGNRTLRSLDVRMPEPPNFGAQNLNVAVDGKMVSPEHDSVADRRMVRTAFDPPWDHLQPREITTEWDLTPGASERGTLAVSADGFYIADATALPLWQAPSGLFARGGSDPDAEILSIYAPPDFRILAPGKPLKRRPDDISAPRRFRIQPHRDFLPYVVAGRYQEQAIRSHDGTVSFWTFRPLDAQAAHTAAARLSSSEKAFADFFGPASSGKTVVRIAEAPGDLPSEFSAASGPGGASFPEGVLLDSRAIAQGVANEAVLQLSEYELARTWFGWRVRPTTEAQILLGRGVGLFGLVIAAEARQPDQRRLMVALLLDRYDQARAIAPDRRLMESAAEYSRAERISNGYRAALFFVALEDFCGHDNLRAAFRYIIRSREGYETDYEELRAAVESTSHQDLAEMFRRWLIQPGVPDDFRARYANPSAAGLQTKR